MVAAMTIALAAPAALARHSTPATGPAVTVCLPDAPMEPNYAIVPVTTSAIFASIGINLEWHDARHCPSDALRISIANGASENIHPGALAYALPYEGTHIVVFLDRVKAMVEPQWRPALLAHVLAHEITHILQGCARHSESGLMKAHWSQEDYRQMSWRNLPFTQVDIALIYDGMARHTAAVALMPGIPR